MTNEQIAELKRIVEGAPDDTWTHIDDPKIKTYYLKMDGKRWFIHNGDEWVDAEDSELHVHLDFHSRKDLETIIAKHEEISASARIAGDLIGQQQRIAELEKENQRLTDCLARKTEVSNQLKGELTCSFMKHQELAATVERFIELRDHLPNVRQWVIEFEKLVHKTPRQNLNAVKREVYVDGFNDGASWALVYCLDETTQEASERMVNTKYPSDKDGK